MLHDTFQRHACEFKDKIYTANLVDDICSLVKTSSGKTEAAKGKHDDCVMSYLMAMYVYYHGDNLLAFGLKKGSQEIDNQNQGLTFDESTYTYTLSLNSGESYYISYKTIITKIE